METWDVVVVGSGGGALTGAVLAALAGHSVCVVEKTALIGGTSAYSGGACWLPDDARTYLSAVLEQLDERAEAFLATAPRLRERLTAVDGLPFEPLAFPEYFDATGRAPLGRSVQPSAVRRDELPPEVADLVRPPVERDRAGQGGRRTLTGGQALVARLATVLLREGGELRTNLPVTGLVTDPDDPHGRVTGVAAMTPEGPVTLGARLGVLLAAGGFEGNADKRAAEGVPGDVAWTMAPRGTNTGEPIDAAVAIGAAADYSAQGWFCPGLAQPDGGGSFTLGFRGGLMVDATGRRYADECLPYDRFGRAMAAAPQRVPSWFVFDDREGGRLPAIAMPEGDPAEHLAAGTWVRADTIADLAAAAGLPVDALEQSVATYNAACAAGRDEEFGRGEDEYDTFFAGGGGPETVLAPCDRPPYVAARLVLSDLGTKGGLVTDAHGRVLRADGSPIRGLYAAGNTAASVFGAVYPAPGAPLGSAMVFAALAVEDLGRVSASAARPGR